MSDKTISNQASVLLGKMVKDGLLTKLGNGRSTTYSPAKKPSRKKPVDVEVEDTGADHDVDTGE